MIKNLFKLSKNQKLTIYNGRSMILKNLCSKINKNIKIDKNIKINKSIKSDKPIKPDKLILTETYKNIELESKKEDNIYNFDTSNFTKKSFRELFIKIDNKIRTNNIFNIKIIKKTIYSLYINNYKLSFL